MRRIECPPDIEESFAPQETDHPLQGGPVIKPEIVKNKLKFVWGCTGLSDYYESACPCCSGTLKVYNPRKLQLPEDGRTRECDIEANVSHNGDGDCPMREVVRERFTFKCEVTSRREPPWYVIHGIKEKLDESVKTRMNEIRS